MGKYDKILFQTLEQSKVKEGIFIALDGPLGPGISHTISPLRAHLVINALEDMAKTLRKGAGIPYISKQKGGR
jgi:hypothetical protein